MANALAYYDKAIFTAVKCFIVQAQQEQEQEQEQKFLNVFSSPSSPPAAPASVANYPMTSVDSTTEDLSPMRVAGGSIRWNHNTDAIQVKNFRKLFSSERKNKLERLCMKVFGWSNMSKAGVLNSVVPYYVSL